MPLRLAWTSVRGALVGVAVVAAAWVLMPAQSQCVTGTGIGAGIDGPSCAAAWFGYGVFVVVPAALVVSFVAGWLVRLRYWHVGGPVLVLATAVAALVTPALDNPVRLAGFAAALFAGMTTVSFLIRERGRGGPGGTATDCPS